MSQRFTLNPFTGKFDAIDISEFITEGADGITTIRWQASDATLWDMTIDSTGAVVTTAVAAVSAYVGANAALSLLGP